MLTRSNLIAIAWVAFMLVLAAWQHRDAMPNPAWPLKAFTAHVNAKLTSTDETR